MRRRFRRIIRINLGLILLSLILAELIFGNWIFGPDYSVLNIPRNEKRYFDVSEFIEAGKVITYSRDRHGLRGEYGGDPKNIDVLVIGGSTTNERFLDDRETWVALLQEQFQRAGKNVVITNASVDGQSTRGHIKAFDLWFPNVTGLRPRYVIGYVGINDLALGKDSEKFDDMQSPQISRRIRQYILNHSVFYNQFRRIRGAFIAQRTRHMHGANAVRTGKWVPVLNWTDRSQLKSELDENLQSYRKRLRVLASRITRFGAMPIYVTQRRGDYRFQDGQLQKMIQINSASDETETSDLGMLQMSKINEVTLSVCQELKITCIDVGADIELEPADFYDGFHTMPSGSAKLAEFLFDELKDILK